MGDQTGTGVRERTWLAKVDKDADPTVATVEFREDGVLIETRSVPVCPTCGDALIDDGDRAACAAKHG